MMRPNRAARIPDELSLSKPGKFAGELLATLITDHPPSIRASAVGRPMPFDGPVMTTDLTMAAAQLPLLTFYLVMARRNMPANPPPINGPSTGTIA